MASAELNKLLESLKKTTSENNIPYMYVDTRKKVTVGVGHNLTAHKDMQTLQFKVKRLSRYPVRGGDIGVSITTNKILGRGATKIEIKNEYDFLIKNHGLGKYLPTQLRKYTTLELSSQTVEYLFIKDRDKAIIQAKK